MISFTANAEPASGDTMAEVSILAWIPGVGRVEQTCPLVDECLLEVSSGSETGVAIYSASAADSGGRRAASAASYIFTIGIPSGAPVFPLRAPFDFYEGDRVFKIILVRDGEFYTTDLVLEDATSLIYDGPLRDPAYRWRDNQLAFYYTTYAGVTADYNSGLITRCGQEPWVDSPDRADAEAAAAFADVVAVIHNHDRYRDCSGLGLVVYGAGAKRNFSAYGKKPNIFHHELGHALAGLSDEYLERTDTRTASGGATFGTGVRCRCCEAGTVCPPGVAPCTGTTPPACLAADRVCPALGSDCPHPNVFFSREECEAAAVFIDSHPGVELRTEPAHCRPLCPLDEEVCPCLPPGDESKIWLLDRRSPPVPGADPDDDVMGRLDGLSPAEWIGPAGESCTETTFCLRWEMGRGLTRAEAEMRCLSPG